MNKIYLFGLTKVIDKCKTQIIRPVFQRAYKNINQCRDNPLMTLNKDQNRYILGKPNKKKDYF